eukprot:TRINITY_DN42048_c0_g1_i1.p1 TRINITY_DN42048_c0_g1~~TRINITY_DN42048_c0_g1_i1.p1  ORF type:complete len:360 (-),score=44.94 TRINITY_DN42048_c0_g1_i1:116-1195(-)
MSAQASRRRCFSRQLRAVVNGPLGSQSTLPRLCCIRKATKITNLGVERVQSSTVTTRSVFSLGKEDSTAAAAWRRARLERELARLGVSPGVLDLHMRGQTLPAHDRLPAWQAVEAFLWPSSADAMAAAWLPGQAQTVAGSLAAELQAADTCAGATNAGLRNVDRTPAELNGSLLTSRMPLTLVLDGLPAEEVGGLLRACETAGVDSVILCGETPGPPEPKVLKTSLRSEAFVAHRRSPSAVVALRKLQSDGFTLWAVSADGRSGFDGDEARTDVCAPKVISLDETTEAIPPQLPLALALLGGYRGANTEKAAAGLRAMSVCDAVVRLPAYGVENTLSGAVTGSIVIYEILRRWRLLPNT